VTHLPKQAQKALAASLLLVAGLGVWFAVVTPLVNWGRSGWEAHRQSLARLERLNELIAKGDELERANQAISGDPGWSRLYEAQAAGTAQAMVQGDIQTIAQSVGVTLESLQPLPEQMNGPVSNVGLRVAFSAPIDALMGFANRLRTAPHHLMIGDFTIVAPQLQNGDANPVLSIQLDVYGVWWKPRP
jgi:hypothetical protein